MQFKLPLLLIATFFIGSIWTKECSKLKSNTKLFCYYGDIKETNNFCQCTHVVLPEATELKIVEKIRKQNADVKILLTVSEFNEKLVALLKGTKVDGVELNLRKMDSKNDLTDFISTVKSKLGSDHYIAVSVPSKTESLAKNFDFKELSKHADVFILNTAFLGASQNVTFHPSRLSGLWDMQNTDSMVDLVSGLGAPLSKIVVAAPVQAFLFTLQNEKYTAPGSPATEVKSITRKELCDLMLQKDAEWTLERDQDQAGPYIFRGKQWIAFEDETSIDIKTKYARVRNLAGVALKDLSQDSETKCGSSILNAAFKGLSRQARAPRGAVLHTLEREILSPSSTHSSSVHDSPFRISRIIDTEGKIHVVRQDTRTEFECSRQGYFVHPRSCNRFYRCVKFDQRTEDYNVFEFDCPAGLTFDEKTEVCVWPGSLPHASACSGSSEIAPVPQKRFTCPTEPGYYADPENCRWFFACLDHGEPTMQAYEFRCPFGLVFDEEKLLCEWPWLVPKCGLGTAVTLNYYGGVSTNINQYDGLGVLQSVKLGGLHGPIQAAEAKTYSNVGFVGLTDKRLTDSQIFSENSARFIDASRRLGLSLKATQSLYNAGLLSDKLAAIGLTQSDFGLENLASEVNVGLHQNSQSFGQQLDGVRFGVSEGQFVNHQNQAYQYTGHNLGEFSSQQSQIGTNDGVDSNSGTDSHQFGLSEGSQIDLSKSQGNSVSYNNIHQQSTFGAIQANKAEGNSNSFANFDQSFQQQLNLEHQNIDTTQNRQIELGLGQQNIDYSDVNQGNLIGNLQYQQDYNKKSQTNGHSQSFANLGQTSHAQFNYQQNNGFGRNDQAQLKQGLLTLSNNQQNLGEKVQYDQGNNYNVATSYVNSVQNAQTELNLQNSGAQQLNVDHSGIQQEGYRTNSEISSKNQQQFNRNLGATGYSSSYFNLGQSSGSQIAVEQKSTIQGQIGQSQQNTQSEYSQSGNLEGVQNLEQINIGANGYEQNSGLLLQNVEINGAAGKYIDDNAQSSFNVGLDSNDFSHVTPATVSHTTATSFESIVSATPLQTIENYEQKQSKDSSRIEYSINNLEESKLSSEFGKTNIGNSATSYQFINQKQPSFGPSTAAPALLQQNIQKLSSIEYHRRPEVTFSVPQLQIVSSTSRPVIQEVQINTAANSALSLEAKPEATFNQKASVISHSSSAEQGIISGQSYSQDGGYTYDKPSLNFEEKPGVLINENRISSSTPVYTDTKVEIPSIASSYSYSNRAEGTRYKGTTAEKQRLYVQQPQVVAYPSTGSSSSYFRQDTGNTVYQTPQIVQQQPQAPYEQKIVSTYNYIKPEVSVTPQTETTRLVSTSFNYINQNQPQEKQQFILKQSEQVSNGYTYVKPVETRVSIEQPKLVLRKPEPVSTSYNYVQPTVQSNIIYEQPQINIQQPATIVENYNAERTSKTEIPQGDKPVISQSFSYTQQDTRGGYRYEVPQVAVQEQPQIIKTTLETGYKYDKPSQVFQEGFNIVQPSVQPVIQKQYSQPISQQQEVTSYQYFQPVVQQPRGFTKTSFQQEAVKTYSYSNPGRTQYVAKPATIVPTNYQSPVYKSEQIEFKGYGYPRPQVQFVEEPKAVVTNYESKVPVVETPIVPKKAYVLGNSFQYERVVPKVQVLKEQRVYTTPKPTFISTIKSLVSGKANPLPQREFIYYDSRLDNNRQNQYFQTSSFESTRIPAVSYSPTISQNVDIKGYSYPKPSIRFEEAPKTSYQYFQSAQGSQIQTTPRPTYVSTIKSVVSQKLEPLEEQFVTSPPAQIQYLESTTLKPQSSVTNSYISRQREQQNIENVEINGYAERTPQIQSFQYQQQSNREQQKEVVVENFVNQQYDQPTYYTTERTTASPVVAQKLEPVTQEYFYYDSRLTSTQAPEGQYVEVATRAPVLQKTQTVEFGGYEYPKPQVTFEEPKVISYGNKVPVVEVPVVPKKAYVTTEQKFNVHTEEETSRPLVLENYVAANYQEHSSDSQLEQRDYVTPRPTYISTVASVIEQKPALRQEFTFFDSRISSTPRSRVVSQKSRISSSRGYSYPKPKLQLSEEPQQVLTRVEVNKEIQPTILENYVSPNYQKYDVSIQSSTPATILSQNVEQKLLRIDNRPRSGYFQVTQGPEQVKLEVTSPGPVVEQKLEQEQPVQPYYYYDSRLSPTQSPGIEIVQEKGEVPQVFRQEITSYDSRYSSTGRPTEEIKSRPSVTIVENEQPIQEFGARQQYYLDASTEKLGIQYAEIESKDPSSTYAPIRKRVRVTKPSRKYLPTSTPSPKYLPSTTLASISNEYLPVASSEAPAEGGISVENYENFELVRKKQRPVKVVKIVRPRVKTVVVKKNDFNPFLSAKLGAQCTCTSNTIELRKEPLRIEVSDEDDDYENDDEGILVEKKDGEAFVIENYESEKIDASTAEPEIHIKSSTVEYRSRKANRGRARAQNVVVENISSRRRSKVNIEASDVNIYTSRVRVKTPRIDIETDDNAEVNIESARSRTKQVDVESGENLEVNSKTFDRYGPGGLRSAKETLQGIDCQRAGLFRHPTQCNKFYSCKWDCKKNKFTLHIFNCPVHLTFDNNLGACNWPSQGPACLENTLLPSE
ncbi:uncharacterized protein LOC123317556 [Coccinella septempunctata]|uniref:uncharacterized protein LOC123317556 n=1 Tax=Coccinella septempunctata TaxID=41139 RepID=UPI001D0960B6|nr:uncharacterized protein LOC123317556 [Coccinella septempunctata]